MGLPTQYAAKLPRPDGVTDTEPVPWPSNNTLSFTMDLKWLSGGKYPNLSSAGVWVTLKDDLTDLDNAAAVHLKKGTNPDPFTVINLEGARLRCDIPAATIAGLTIGTVYYIDVQVSDGGKISTVVFDFIKTFQQVTKSTT